MYYAHGKTLKEAYESLDEKMFDDLDTDERIEMFLSEFDVYNKYKTKVFFEWHGKLTGSCLQGRESFVKNKSIDLEKMISVRQFISICKNEYGSEIIEKLEECINDTY